MTLTLDSLGLETKYRQFGSEIGVKPDNTISGYASLFGAKDEGGDTVAPGAYAASLKRLMEAGRKVKMLWQHDPGRPIGVWDEIWEDKKGLFVKGRLLSDVQLGAEAIALIKAGAIEGLSIGYRTRRAEKNTGGGRLLHEVELWEVSLVTFPMLPEARIQATDSSEEETLAQSLTDIINDARRQLT